MIKGMSINMNYYFPIVVCVVSFFSYKNPEYFVELKDYIIFLVGVTIFTMGLTLTPSNFLDAFKKRRAIVLGFILQFSIMPLVAFLVATLLNMTPAMIAGMILVGCVSGGTASNVMCYLAKGDVALSITMTTLSTFGGIIITPLLLDIMTSNKVVVPALDMAFNLAKIILFPVITSVLLRVTFKKLTMYIERYLPIVSMASIIITIATVVAINQKSFIDIDFYLFTGVVIHNSLGLSLGYFITRIMGFDEKTSRTISLEVGLQNSGLAIFLAIKYFTPASALAGVIFSVWHNVSGSIMSSIWERMGNSSNKLK